MLGIPRLPNDVIYEVQVVGEQRVYRVRHRRMMEWANEQALRGRGQLGSPTMISRDRRGVESEIWHDAVLRRDVRRPFLNLGSDTSGRSMDRPRM
jgi:hypothetical protein